MENIMLNYYWYALVILCSYSVKGKIYSSYLKLIHCNIDT